MNYICELFEQQEQPVVSIRTRTAVGNLPLALGKAYGSLMQYLAEAAEQPSGAPYVAYYNMDMRDLDIDVGFPVSRSLPGKDDVKPSL
jgi:effector-binding domain-containing protein